MRFCYVAALLVSLAAVTASAQTFNVEQPKDTKGTVKVIRPGQDAASSANPKTKTMRAMPNVKDVAPAPTGKTAHVKVTAKRTARAPVKVAAEKPAPVVPTPAPVAVAKASPPLPPDPLSEPLPTISSLSSSELRQKIQQSLSTDPDLSAGNSVHVTVTETEIQLDGTVANNKDKLTAERLAQSFGGNRLFKDSLQIAGSHRASTPPTDTATTGMPTAVGDNFAGRPKS